MLPFSVIVAVDRHNGIGRGGTLPWRISSDLKHFKEVTMKTSSHENQNALIMGRKTWDSLPDKYKPLPGRINVVVSRNKNLTMPENVYLSDSFENALHVLEQDSLKERIESVFVIGGAQIYETAFKHPQCQKIYLTKIDKNFNCDTFLPPFPENFKEDSNPDNSVNNGSDIHFLILCRK